MTKYINKSIFYAHLPVCWPLDTELSIVPFGDGDSILTRVLLDVVTSDTWQGSLLMCTRVFVPLVACLEAPRTDATDEDDVEWTDDSDVVHEMGNVRLQPEFKSLFDTVDDTVVTTGDADVQDTEHGDTVPSTDDAKWLILSDLWCRELPALIASDLIEKFPTGGNGGTWICRGSTAVAPCSQRPMHVFFDTDVPVLRKSVCDCTKMLLFAWMGRGETKEGEKIKW